MCGGSGGWGRVVAGALGGKGLVRVWRKRGRGKRGVEVGRRRKKKRRLGGLPS